MFSFVRFIMNQIKLNGAIDLLGRLMLAALFLSDGVTVINNYEATAEYLSQFGVPPILLIPALLLQQAVAIAAKHHRQSHAAVPSN